MNTIKAINLPLMEGGRLVSPLKTYKMDFGARRIGGFCEGQAALRQYIHKALCTKRFGFLIYDGDYGSEVDSVRQAGYLNTALLASQLELAVREALMENERIQEVRDFSYSVLGDKFEMSFTVDSQFGDISIREVL